MVVFHPEVRPRRHDLERVGAGEDRMVSEEPDADLVHACGGVRRYDHVVVALCVASTTAAATATATARQRQRQQRRGSGNKTNGKSAVGYRGSYQNKKTTGWLVDGRNMVDLTVSRRKMFTSRVDFKLKLAPTQPTQTNPCRPLNLTTTQALSSRRWYLQT